MVYPQPPRRQAGHIVNSKQFPSAFNPPPDAPGSGHARFAEYTREHVNRLYPPPFWVWIERIQVEEARAAGVGARSALGAELQTIVDTPGVGDPNHRMRWRQGRRAVIPVKPWYGRKRR